MIASVFPRSVSESRLFSVLLCGIDSVFRLIDSDSFLTACDSRRISSVLRLRASDSLRPASAFRLRPHSVLNTCSGKEGRSVKNTVRWTVISGVHEGLCPRAVAFLVYPEY